MSGKPPEAPAEPKGECCREITEAQGGVSRDTDRGLARARPRMPRAESKFRLIIASPGPLTERGGSSAHFLTRLRAALKGQLSRPFPLPAAVRSAPASLHLCPQTCPLLPGISGDQGKVFKCYSLSHFLEGSVILPSTCTICSPRHLQID